MSSDDRLWTAEDVARYLGLSRKTVGKLVGLTPTHIHAAGEKPIVRYHPDDVKKWARNRRQVGERIAS